MKYQINSNLSSYSKLLNRKIYKSLDDLIKIIENKNYIMKQVINKKNQKVN
jgi:hypothetical protein